MKKKLLAFLLAASMVFALAGCGSSGTSSAGQSDSVTSSESSIVEEQEEPEEPEESASNVSSEVIVESSDTISEEIESEVQNEEEEAGSEDQSEDADSEELVDGMRPEIKQAIDDYEAFFDEYCEFMITYSESDDAMSMLTDYAKFMAQYATTMSSLEAMEDEDLNDAELLYYTEAVARITQELAELAVTISE